MYLVLLILIAAIVHASLYPWEFRFAPPDVNPLVALFTSWRPIVSRRLAIDFAANILFYIPLGAAAFLAFSRRVPKTAAVALAAALGFALSAGVEMTQLFTTRRMCSTADLLSNVLGAAIGACAAVLARDRLKRMSAPHPHLSTAAFLLLCCWAGYQLFPLFPETSRFALRARLYGLFEPQLFSPLAAAVAAAEWLAAARLIAVWAGPKHARWLAAALLCLLPARMAMAGRAVAWHDIAGAAAGVSAAAFLRVPFRIAAGLLGAAVLARGLEPFRFAGPQPFEWVPFASLVGGWSMAAATLLRKIFWYGAILLLWRAGGGPARAGAAMLIALTAAIEIAQTRIPGHVAETTDPLLVLLAALALGAARATASPRRT